MSHHLPLFAEAAPDPFLAAVRIALHGNEPVGREFFRDSSTDWIGFSSSPHTGLLWSLEMLKRSPDYVAAATLLLARLAALERERGFSSPSPTSEPRSVHEQPLTWPGGS